MATIKMDEEFQEQFHQFKKYKFDFENLAFAGGGAKIASYLGGIMALEELDILPQCKRFAGTSGGAIIASFLAINLNASTVKRLMQLNMKTLLIDSSFGAISMVPNVMYSFGWNPANKFLNALKDIMEEHTGNANITFEEVYKRYNKVLCVVATNVSTMSVEYFHPKTTPDFPVVLAVKSSTALPGYLQPVRHETEAGISQYYVDGGLVCNFPLHVFDGWYLSMDMENSFFNKLGGTEPPFDAFNNKTLGFVLHTAWGGEFMQGALHKRQNDKTIKRPDTVLAKSRQGRCEEIRKESERRHQIVEAGERFLQILREVDINRDCEISLKEFKEAFDKVTITTEDKEILFGKDFEFEQAFKDIDKDTNGMITFDEFLWYMQKKGINFRALIDGGCMMNINTFGEFFEVTFNTILNMTRKVYYKEHDFHRTVAIYTDYIDTTDFHLEQDDKDFIARQGVTATLTYFRELLDKWANKKLPLVMQGCIHLKEVSDE